MTASRAFLLVAVILFVLAAFSVTLSPSLSELGQDSIGLAFFAAAGLV